MEKEPRVQVVLHRSTLKALNALFWQRKPEKFQDLARRDPGAAWGQLRIMFAFGSRFGQAPRAYDSNGQPLKLLMGEDPDERLVKVEVVVNRRFSRIRRFFGRSAVAEVATLEWPNPCHFVPTEE